MNYTDYIGDISLLMGTTTTDPSFVAIVPSMISYAELRIYREMDFITTVTRNSTGTLSVGTRQFTFPEEFVTSQNINVITPASATLPDLGTRNQLIPTSKEFLDAVYSSTTGAGVPQYYAPLTDQTILVGPFPDQAYTVEVIGTTRPAPLSSTNATTYLSLYLPDLFICASMVYASGYMKNYGSANIDDPQQAMSWEAQYQAVKTGATMEEFRKKYMARGWSSETPTPVATPAV